MKTLYVTDLDGTLLRKDQTVSNYSKRIINSLVDNGMLFTFATARSRETADIVTMGLKISAPCVLYNGAFVRSVENEILLARTFNGQSVNIIMDLISADIFPIVYSLRGEQEKFSFIPNKLSRAATEFINTRTACARYNPVNRVQDLINGDVFYITCIDDSGKLTRFYEKYKNDCYCVYSNDIYTGAQWLEIMPKSATKANALSDLKQMLNCKLAVFGDGINDKEMFGIADERYAVENAVSELKEIATEVIADNNSDGVAKQLKKLFT